MTAPQIIFIAGAFPFILLGVAHVVLTLRDLRVPQVLAPANVRLTPATNIWSAWIGFNISHGLGAAAFGLLLTIIAVEDFEQMRWLAPLAIAIGSIYFWVSLRFWFKKPTVGIGIGVSLWALAWVMELLFNLNI